MKFLHDSNVLVSVDFRFRTKIPNCLVFRIHCSPNLKSIIFKMIALRLLKWPLYDQNDRYLSTKMTVVWPKWPLFRTINFRPCLTFWFRGRCLFSQWQTKAWFGSFTHVQGATKLNSRPLIDSDKSIEHSSDHQIF